MDTFGDTLKAEREERRLSLETVAAVIGIERDSLEALERNEFDSLPDHEVMLEGLRAYADCLQVDAEMMIEHYERERERSLRQLADAVADTAVVTGPVVIPPALRQRRRRFPHLLVAAVFVAILAVVGVWWTFRGEGRSAPMPAPSHVDAPTRATDRSPAASTPPATVPTVTRPAPSRSRIAIGEASGLSIPEYGVGTEVKSRQLVGRSDRFVEGTQAWFWTQVEGGKPGDRIDHVWLREGVEAMRIPLNIGGSRWRTQSAKTLRSAGAWTVEARDAAGRILARVEFDCVR